MQRFLVPTMFLVLIAGGPALAVASAPTAPGAPVLVVAGDAERIVRHAGGRTLGPSAAAFGTLASSPDGDFLRRLHDGGAWLVLDGRIIAAICGANP